MAKVGMLYTCGRLHRPMKQKNHSGDALRLRSTVSAIEKMMRSELSDAARERWCAQLNGELGLKVFSSTSTASADAGGQKDKIEPDYAVPKAWIPSKPRLAVALLDELARAQDTGSAKPPRATISMHGQITKVLARQVIDSMRQEKGEGWLAACGELSEAQLGDPNKLSHTLARVAFDLLVYVFARALEFQRADNANDALLLLHGSDDTLVGRAMRGCGVVHCEAGRAIFVRAVESVRERLAASLAL